MEPMKRKKITRAEKISITDYLKKLFPKVGAEQPIIKVYEGPFSESYISSAITKLRNDKKYGRGQIVIIRDPYHQTFKRVA